MNQQLVTIIARQQIACGMSIDAEVIANARAIVAGVLAASKVLLTPQEFDRLIASCDLDTFLVNDLLALAIDDPKQQPESTIEI